MAFTMFIELQVTVQNDEQAEKIMEAVQSGLAEIAIKDRVLFDGKSPEAAPATFASKRNQTEASKKLTPVAAHTPKRDVAVQETSAPKERSRGVLGRSKLHRVGRN